MLNLFNRSNSTARSFASDAHVHAEAVVRQTRPVLPTRLRLVAGSVAEVGQFDAPVSEQTRLAFENSLVATVLRNTWFFSPVIETVAAKIKDIVVPVFRKVYLYKKYPNCFPEPSAAESALFNCFFYSADARTGYFAYRSDVRHGIPLQGMVAVPKTPEEIQGMIDYYSGHVFGHIGAGRAIEEKWTAIRDFGLFIKEPSCFSARKLTIDDIDFIKPEQRKVIKARIDECRNVAQNDFGLSVMPVRSDTVLSQSTLKPQSSSLSAQSGLANLGNARELHPFSGPIVRHERAVPLALAPIDPEHEIRDRKVGFSWQMQMEQKNERIAQALRDLEAPVKRCSEREPTACADSNASPEAVMLVGHFLGGLTECGDLQKLSMLSFARSFPQGGTSFHESAAVAKKFGVPYTAGSYASAIPAEWHARLPELDKLRHKFPELL